MTKTTAGCHHWGAGCLVCSAQLALGSMARFTVQENLQLSHFLEHQKLPSHKRNFDQFLNGRTHLRAPSTAAFDSVWRARVAGKSFDFDETIGRTAKLRRMTWCLAEAKRTLHRAFLRSSVVIGIRQDVSRSRLLIRFAATQSGGHMRRGVLGMEKDIPGGGRALVTATNRIISRICTRGRCPLPHAFLSGGQPPDDNDDDGGKPLVEDDGGGEPPGRPPRHGGGKPPIRDVALYLHIRRSIEMFTADAASDEMLAAKYLRERGVVADIPPDEVVLPALFLVGRDKAHGARRVTQRTWRTDEYLNALVQTLFYRKGSICALIENSHVFKSWFAANKTRMCGTIGANIRSLSLAKHRYDSCQRPLGRSVLFMNALLQTATQIATSRHGRREAVKAQEFLHFIDDEAILQLGMLADSGDEAIQLIRVMDSEDLDLSEMPSAVQRLIHSITALFVQGECVHCGYTAYALQYLRRPHVFFFRDEQVCVGGRDGATYTAMAKRCLQRMSCWVRLAIAVLHAEFPNFEILSAFSLFELGAECCDGGQPLALRGVWNDAQLSARDGKLKCLAHTFGLDVRELTAQYLDLLPIARSIFINTGGCTNIAAWIEALRKVGRHHDKHPVDALHRIILRWVPWTAVTAGVEQNFAWMDKLFKGGRRNAISPGGEEDLLILAADNIPRERGEVLKLAREIWASHYGPPRSAGRHVRNVNFGTKLNVVPDPTTEIAFVRKRREAVAGLVGRMVDTPTPTPPRGGGYPPPRPPRGGPVPPPPPPPPPPPTPPHFGQLRWRRNLLSRGISGRSVSSRHGKGGPSQMTIGLRQTKLPSMWPQNMTSPLYAVGKEMSSSAPWCHPTSCPSLLGRVSTSPPAQNLMLLCWPRCRKTNLSLKPIGKGHPFLLSCVLMVWGNVALGLLLSMEHSSSPPSSSTLLLLLDHVCVIGLPSARVGPFGHPHSSRHNMTFCTPSCAGRWPTLGASGKCGRVGLRPLRPVDPHLHPSVSW